MALSKKSVKPASSASRRSGNPAKAAAERKRIEESRASANRVSRVPRKVKATGSPRWYAPSMVAIMVIGLLWVVVTYLFKGEYPLPYFVEHHASDWLVNGNLYLGFVIMMLGFLGLLRWR
ncbi:MAG: cell division protein CrgA [Actinomyces sp.]|uniref:cell division protein CrgA n=1 Tax=Actinomyces sp. TaxID=29317 RepID=UPI0026DC80CB|nr:cell division protein CrgA [Actinomyces sp.]MDO4242773.1 cell division protein CrgA [Actinomyces sp.]